MPLVIVGVLLLLLKWADLGPFGGMSWGWVVAPFIGAVAWWAVADSMGLTQRRAMQRDERRKQQRRDRAIAALRTGSLQGNRVATPMRDPTTSPTDDEPPRGRDDRRDTRT